MINSYSGSIVVFLLNTNIDKNSLQIYKNLGFFSIKKIFILIIVRNRTIMSARGENDYEYQTKIKQKL